MKKFAVFDIDGTLIRWQLYHTLVDRLAKSGALGKDSSRQIREARMNWKRRESSESFRDYERKLIDAYESALTNIKTEEFDKLVLEVIDEYKDQVYTYTRDLIKRLKSEGYFLLAISGSHHELIAHMAKYYGFNDYIGTQYERSGDSFSGKVFVPSFDKESALKDLVKKHNLDYAQSYAVGDSLSDASMLKLVQNPVAFNPDQNLFKVAEENGWNIVVERKNMIYQLEYNNGTYQLKKT